MNIWRKPAYFSYENGDASDHWNVTNTALHTQDIAEIYHAITLT